MGADIGKILGGVQTAAGIGATVMGQPQVGLPMMGSGFQSIAGPSGGGGTPGAPTQQGPLSNPMSQMGGMLNQAGPAMAALGLGGHQQQQAPTTPPPPAMAQRPMPQGSTAGGAMPTPQPNPMPKPPSGGPGTMGGGSPMMMELLKHMGMA